MKRYRGLLDELIYKYPRQIGQNKSICIPLHENEKFKDWLYSIDEDYPINIREIRIEFFYRTTLTKIDYYDQYIIRETCVLETYMTTKKVFYEDPDVWTFEELFLMGQNECNVDDVVNEILHLWYEDFDKDYKFSYYIKPHEVELELG